MSCQNRPRAPERRGPVVRDVVFVKAIAVGSRRLICSVLLPAAGRLRAGHLISRRMSVRRA